jgi:hypothetical protein
VRANCEEAFQDHLQMQTSRSFQSYEPASALVNLHI